MPLDYQPLHMRGSPPLNRKIACVRNVAHLQRRVRHFLIKRKVLFMYYDVKKLKDKRINVIIEKRLKKDIYKLSYDDWLHYIYSIGLFNIKEGKQNDLSFMR